MPVFIEGLQQVAVLDLPVAAGTAFWLGVHLFLLPFCYTRVRIVDIRYQSNEYINTHQSQVTSWILLLFCCYIPST